MALALFDMDQTLIAGDTQVLWFSFLGERGLVDAAATRREGERLYADYVAGTMDIDECMRFELSPLAAYERPQLDQWRQAFFETAIYPVIKPAMRERVEQHRERGDLLVMITAANHYMAQPLFQELGMHRLVATVAEEVDGHFTGNYVGTPSFREGKVTLLNELIAREGLSMDDSYCYSDSQNDLPLLLAADHAIAVDPCPILRAEALQRQWTIIDT